MSVEEKEITTREWYDFIGYMADIIPTLHLGGKKATTDLLKMCEPTAESHVLDIGCGSGYTACEIASEYGSRVTGIDISENMIEKAKQRAKRERLEKLVEFRVADVFSLPFDDDAFDIALFESVLTPLPGDKLEALRETVRVIQPSGLVGVNESIISSTAPKEFLSLAEEHPATHRFFTPETLKTLLEGSGLEIVEMTEILSSETPRSTSGLGLINMISFMVKAYWRVLWRIISDPRFRKAAKTDEKVSTFIKEHGGYVLIVGRVPE
jgi:ubiquinone/menaquinone biosynthesis C-methylase UbiE